ncbi:MAG: hypothetical protein PUP92_16460 [Rhizonema sp. PD38]|nr:hypothetical protein [Rhizonema sp. PD38]
MTVDNIPVNVAIEFSLSGEGTTISYSTVHEPVLTYQGKLANPARKFSGKEIIQQNTEIGTLITVVLGREILGAVTTETRLSVLLPKVVVGEKNPVKTEAILTTSISGAGIGFPKSGQLETYEFVPLTGTASSQGS